MKFLGKVHVTLKKSVLDPQGTTIKHAIDTLGFEGIGDVRLGKYIEISVEAPSHEAAEHTLKTICDKLLHNPVIEVYSFEIK